MATNRKKIDYRFETVFTIFPHFWLPFSVIAPVPLHVEYSLVGTSYYTILELLILFSLNLSTFLSPPEFLSIFSLHGIWFFIDSHLKQFFSSHLVCKLTP